MIMKQEFTQEEIEQRAKENNNIYFENAEDYPDNIDCENTNLEEPEESYYW